MPWAGGVATEKATAPPPGSAAARVSVVGVFSSVVADRASATGIAGRMTVSVKVCGGLVSTPPLPVPPLSSRTRVIVADPLAPGFGETPVDEFRKTFGRTAAHALSWAVRRDQLGMFFFQRAQPLDQPVIFAIGNFRIVVKVIEVFVAANLFAQRRAQFLD